MILPVNLNSQQGYYKSKQINSDRTLSSCVKPNFAELSDYKTGQAILVRNNINFKSQDKLIPINKVYEKQVENRTIDIYYPYVSNDKNDTLAYYSAMLLLCLTPPFHCGMDKKNFGNKTYLMLKMNPEYFDLKTYGECYEKQQPSIQAVRDIYFNKTLDDMKQMDIELLEDDYKNGIIDKKKKDNDIEVINSITVEDVREYMDKYLLNQKPLVIE